MHRIDGGGWDGSTEPGVMNGAAARLGSLNVLAQGATAVPTPSAFFHFVPPVELRPFTR